MYRVIAGNRYRAVPREIRDVDAGDVYRKAINGWIARADATTMLCNGGDEVVLASGIDGDDDVLRAGVLNAVLEVRLRRGSMDAGQDSKSCQHQDTHSAAENHGLYYSKGSAM